MTDPAPSRPNLRFARGELVFGYRLVRKLGEGSFGSVWLAANEKGFEWALKIVNLGGSGGQKEFKALQLIKDRKINNTSLLKLIDYGLLDRDGTSLAAALHVPSSPPAVVDLAEPPDDAPNPAAGPQGTLVPLEEKVPVSRQTAVEKVAARETQREPPSGDTKSDEQCRATWLVIVMEVGQLTLHQLQLRATQKDFENSPRQQTRAVTRMGMTAAGRKSGSAGKATTVDPVEEPLVPLPVAQVLPYIEQAARGLDYLHRHDIVHRDIKPQNIILVGDDAKVCDYGLASEFNNSTATTIGCTPAYAAPEAINNRPVPASDQYSLAITYIELVTGRWPFFGVTQTAIYREKDEGKHNLTFIASPAVRTVLKKALSKLPRDRYPTCVQFVDQLKLAENARPGLPQWLKISIAALLILTIGGVAFGWGYPSLSRLIAQREKTEPLTPPEPPDVIPEPIAPIPEPIAPDAPPMPLAIVSPPPATPLLPPDDAQLAAIELSTAFADPGLQPLEVLRTFEKWIPKSKQADYWWRALQAKAKDPRWQPAIEKWLLLNRGRQEGWMEASEYIQFAERQQAASLQRLLQRSTSTSEEIQEVLDSDAFHLNDAHALAILLRIDLEMRQLGAAATLQDRARWDGSLESAFQQKLAGVEDAQRRQLALYLSSQKLGPQSTVAELQEGNKNLVELLGASPALSLLTKERKDRLANPLGYVTLSELQKTDRDLPVFDQFHLARVTKFYYLLQLADAHGLQSPALDAARAFLLANQALEARPPRTVKAEWKEIARLADNAYRHEAYEFLKKHNCRLLLIYLLNYATLQTAEPGGEDFSKAVSAFAIILQSKQDQAGSPLYFDFAGASQPHDVGVYRHLVQPVLDHPGLQQQSMLGNLDPSALAMLWGVRGALLRRSPAIAPLVAAPKDQTMSQATHILLLQQRAFQEAIKYDARATAKSGAPTNPHFAAGANQVLAALPRHDETLTLSLPDLLAIVDEFDPSGNTMDVELLRLGAHVRMQQALLDRNPASRKQFAQDAVRRYERLISANLPTDPRHHRAVASERLSDLHWNLSQWTEFGVADYEFSAEKSEAPRAATKSYHLWQAKRFAQQAVAIPSRPQKEIAYLKLANAQEQMATALGQVEQYDQAVQSLVAGIQEATAGKRSTSQLQALHGRCLLRHAQELFANLTSNQQIEKANAAVAELTASLAGRKQTGSYGPQDADTLFNLAEAHLLLAQQLPDEKTERLEAARKELTSALAAAGTDSPRIGHYRWRLLVVLSHQGIGTSSDPSRKGRELADQTLQDALKNPSAYEPTALFGIATQAAWLHYDRPATMQTWLPDRGPLFTHWRSSEAARLEAVRLYCEASVVNPNDQSLRSSARQLAGALERGSLAYRQAEAWIADSIARERCISFEKYKPPTSTNATNTQEQNNRVGEEAQAKIAVNSIQEAYDKHLLCVDSHMKPFVDELRQASLDNIMANKVLQNLTVLEKRALWKLASTGPALETRKKFCEICLKAQGASTGGADSAATKSDAPKLVQDLLKPVLLFDDLQDREPRIADFVKLYKPPAAEGDKTKGKTPAKKP